MSMTSAVAAPVRHTLRGEALLALLVSLLAYQHLSGDWARFATWFLVPDLALLGYLIGPRAGAWAYNLLHSYVGPLLLGAVAHHIAAQELVAMAGIWMAHIAMDRALGYGLKYPAGFAFTHLGRIGRQSKNG